MNFKTIGHRVATAHVASHSYLKASGIWQASCLIYSKYQPIFEAYLARGKFLGVFVLIVRCAPLLKKWAHAGFFFTLSGASTYQLLFRDSFSLVLASLMVPAVGSLSFFFARRLRSSPPLNAKVRSAGALATAWIT